ncbi:cation diffusion facilitator family transporter [Beijerinckia sp. L45]|uniref:cation diffusion facilitator family transporter n=1 Tax=Beijerinckia sp. L45 TaxID=1641855 RepID=UPI00131C9477|nr:cation diffusion facilitator family transporter [Beijerinckia sp. L45]
MMDTVRDWLGFGGADVASSHAGHGHSHDEGKGHGHTHGVIDPSIASSEEGISAIKWSFAILAVTALLQFIVVVVSGSVALLADMIHNVGDATTAIPLWFAFMLARRKPSKTFTYGLGRAEDLAGIMIVLIILFSAVVAGYEAISRLLHPEPVQQLDWLAAAGVIGFLGNEIVAVFRIRVGRRMNSAALIADGYHARTDGLTSLAVVLGALGVWMGFPLADPIIGLIITVAIFGIVWQSSRAVITRMLDGVEPGITEEIRHSAGHVPGIRNVTDAKARWLGHELHADVTIAVDDQLPLAKANLIAAALQGELRAHIPAMAVANVRFENGAAVPPAVGGHHHAPEPFKVDGQLAKGLLEIADTSDGERMRLTVGTHVDGLNATVVIKRPGEAAESLPLTSAHGDHHVYESASAPAEPHEFDATLFLRRGAEEEALPFHMSEPDDHSH